MRIVDTVELSRQKYLCHIHLQKIWPALQPLNCPMPFKTQPLQRRLVTLAKRNFKHCANYHRFSQRPFRLEMHTIHPQWRKIPHNSGALSHRATAHMHPPPRMRDPPVPATPTQSPHLAHHRSQRVSPSQAPSTRVAPRMNPIDVSSPRVMPTLPLTDVIPLTPHPEAESVPMCLKAWQV
jgi:hypothetical protein